MFIIKNKKIFIGISVILIIFSILSLFVFGLKIGIDFKGGAMTEVYYPNGNLEDVSVLKEKIKVANQNIGEVLIQPTGDKGYIIKTRDLSEQEHASLLNSIKDSSGPEGVSTMEEKSFNSIGPSVGRELTRKAIIAIILVSLGIILFIAFAFRKVSKPVSSWKYGVIAIVSLLHDVLIPIGIFALLSHYRGIELDTLFVVAALTILGLSVSDTIVIFDRIRENIRNQGFNIKSGFDGIVGKSLEQSYVRSICTSLTVILVLLSLFFFGPTSTKYFALVLAFGMFFGTYSSIFLASPLLVWVEEWQSKKKK